MARRSPSAGVAVQARLKRLRALCLALPETSETGAWGHPNFRAGRRCFVTFEWLGMAPTFAFCLGADAVQRYLGRPGFQATPYGRGQWVSLAVAGRPDWRLVEGLVRQSYEAVALPRMLAALAARDAEL